MTRGGPPLPANEVSDDDAPHGGDVGRAGSADPMRRSWEGRRGDGGALSPRRRERMGRGGGGKGEVPDCWRRRCFGGRAFMMDGDDYSRWQCGRGLTIGGEDDGEYDVGKGGLCWGDMAQRQWARKEQ
jgi:hypothetical protein